MSAHSLTLSLGGRWYGDYGFVRCVAHKDGRPSLRLRDGDNGRLLVRCFAGCDPRAILDALKQRNILGQIVAPRPPDLAEIKKQTERRRRRKVAATEMFGRSAPAPGTVVESYLRGRGINLPIPASIRFAGTQTHPHDRKLYPVMIAAVCNANRQIVGCHRTYLRVDGSAKADVPDARLSLGSLSEGCVHLAEAWDVMAVCEGIETGLAYMQLTGIPTWACLSTAGLQNAQLPDGVVHVAIAADVDQNNAGMIAAKKLEKRLINNGIISRIVVPELDVAGDFNDMLLSP